jgi:transposase InsO family protein
MKEAKELAWQIHRENGHFGRDMIKIQLMSRICSPKLDQSIVAAITECGRCKNFGSTHIHSLLEPITRRHPFELMVGDTLSLPLGKGGFKKLSLYMDVYSQYLWTRKLKTAASGKTTVAGMDNISSTFPAPETLMVDGGPEFDNHEVRAWCDGKGTTLHIVPAYSPWVNGLLEGMNGKLLNRLKRMCAPDLGEDEYDAMGWDDLPKNWPDHLDAAVESLNSRILPNLRYSPNELLLGLVINTNRTPVDEAAMEPTAENIALQMAYVGQQRLDGYSQMVDHAHKRKAEFDAKVQSRAPREVIFKAGWLVQVYRSDLDYTFKSIRKIEPKWSAPRRVVSRRRNSYTLETLEGLPISGRFSARRLRRFIPRTGTALAEAQLAVELELGIAEEMADRVVVEDDGVRGENSSDDEREELEVES